MVIVENAACLSLNYYISCCKKKRAEPRKHQERDDNRAGFARCAASLGGNPARRASGLFLFIKQNVIKTFPPPCDKKVGGEGCSEAVFMDNQFQPPHVHTP